MRLRGCCPIFFLRCIGGLFLLIFGVLLSLSLAIADDEMDEIFWQTVEGCESLQGTKLYLEEFPEGKYATEAAGCIAWEEVKGCEDKRAVQEFLGNYPKSRNSKDARACLATARG